MPVWSQFVFLKHWKYSHQIRNWVPSLVVGKWPAKPAIRVTVVTSRKSGHHSSQSTQHRVREGEQDDKTFHVTTAILPCMDVDLAFGWEN